MKQFSCGDIVPGCAARFHARSVAEVEALVADHACDVHAMTRPLPGGFLAQVRSAIRDAA